LKNLLFLVHRLPFPPTKGDKIRSYHLLQRLSQDYRVYLGTFVDDPSDWKHVDHVRSLCKAAHFSELKSGAASVRSLSGLLSGAPLSLPFYRDKGLQEWVDSTLANVSISRILVFSSVMAQYVTQHHDSGRRTIVDFVDVDSDKWRQYAERKSWPMNWIYRREGRRLLDYERTVSGVFDLTVFVSREEAKLFANLAPECSDRIVHINNGVDAEQFSPDAVLPNPYPPDESVLVFTGAMDYWANVDAVTWFAGEVFPAVREQFPNARFYVVGARPTTVVRRLQSEDGIVVTGAVEDVRPYVAHARVSVAPMRIARGIQNKVLEALAMGKPVVASVSATEGIEPWPDGSIVVAGNATSFAQHICRLLNLRESPVDKAALGQWISNHYSWRRNLDAMVRMLEGENICSTGVSNMENDGDPRVGMAG
jgi:sugar transferase (PEP-CTERM/EpsH1 system associated)